MFQPRKKEVFRKVALERLSSPEELDQLMQVTTPKGWLALLGLGSLLVIALIWGFFGNIPTKVTGHGILLRTGGVYHIPVLTSGQVSKIYVQVGDIVAEGQTVARIFQVGDGSTSRARVTSPHAGRVLEIITTEGSMVNAGSPIISLEALNQETQAIEAIIYMPAEDGRKIHPNMPAEITPSTVKREEFGFIPGRVVYVSPYPVTQQGMLQTLGSEELVQQFASLGAVIEIRADLAEDPNSVSGYRWSSKGPNVIIENGTLATAQLITEQRRPISLVIPLLKKMLTGRLFGE